MYNCTCPVRKSCLFSHEYICIIIYSLSMYCKVVYDRNQEPILVSVSKPNFFSPKHPCFPFPTSSSLKLKTDIFLFYNRRLLSFGCTIRRQCHSPKDWFESVFIQYVVMSRIRVNWQTLSINNSVIQCFFEMWIQLVKVSAWKYWPFWVLISVPDLNQSSSFGRTLL